ncbi:hypothetical protein [Micromonospora zamorensis]|uniref:hypothetical protein n=1 Tax=Micromonospora zamorensis TaxID=709883 RepID=UPI0037A066F1
MSGTTLIDLSDLDTTSIAWSDGSGDASDLYTLAPAGGVAVSDGPANGRSCCGGPCGLGRPIAWCCVGCH